MKYSLIYFVFLFFTGICFPSESENSIIHPNFDLSMTELESLIPVLTFGTKQSAQRFLSLAHQMLQASPEYLILIDKTHPLPLDYQPDNLKTLSTDSFFVNKNGMKLDSRACKSLLTMTKKALESGIQLHVSSAYRSSEYQRKIHESYIKRFGYTEAIRFSTPPGYSQHQLGTSVDFGSVTNKFAETPAGNWLMQNAGDYGWSLSYPKETTHHPTGYQWESWHWRWIGIDATAMQDEFFDNSQQRLLEFWHQYNHVLRTVHSVKRLINLETR